MINPTNCYNYNETPDINTDRIIIANNDFLCESCLFSNGTRFAYDGTMGSVIGAIGGKYLEIAQNMGSPFGHVAMVFELISLS